MSSSAVFAGSKRQARLRARDQREADRVKRELQDIYLLAQSIRDETHFRDILAEVAGVEDRERVAKLIIPFLPFRIQRVEPVSC